MENFADQIQKIYPRVLDIQTSPREIPRSDSLFVVKFGNTGLEVHLQDKCCELHFKPRNFTGDLELTLGLKFEHSVMLVAGLYELSKYWLENQDNLPPVLLNITTHQGLKNQLVKLTLDLFDEDASKVCRVEETSRFAQTKILFDIHAFATRVLTLKQSASVDHLVDSFIFFKRLSVIGVRNLI